MVPACLFPALAIPRPTEVCVRGARVQRGDQRTEPRRLSGVSSRPAKVGAAGTRLALWNAGTFWTRHLGISQRAALLRSSRQRLPRRPTHFLHNKALSSSSRQRTSQLRISREQRISGGEFFLLGFSWESSCVQLCFAFALGLLASCQFHPAEASSHWLTLPRGGLGF